VLEAPPPRFTGEEIAAIAAGLFGVEGVARDLGSERDQTFLVDDGAAGAVLKVSNAGEDPAALDLETAAIAHIGRADPDLRVARPRPAQGSADPADPAAFRPTVPGPDGTHFVRCFERLEGRTGSAPDLGDDALRHFGVTQARLARALRGFFHPPRAASCCGTSGTRRGCGRCWGRSPTRAGGRCSRACSTATTPGSRRPGPGCARRSSTATSRSTTSSPTTAGS
jgi:hypothetical protein